MRNARKMAMLTSLVGGLLLAGGVACAGSTPAKNVSAHRHPNLAAAQKLSSQAYQKLVAAQVANEWDLGGHAEKAKALLQQANDEMKLAAEAANGNWK